MSKFLLWERRSHSISYVGTPFPCVPAPLHHWIELTQLFVLQPLPVMTCWCHHLILLFIVML